MANTIADKLTYLSGTKDAIKQAIIGKGVDVTDSDTFRSYADKISSIQTGGGTANIPDGTRFGYSTFTTVPDSIIPYLESQTDMSNMFDTCSFLKTVPLFDTNKCTIFTGMFRNCVLLNNIPLYDMSNATMANSMLEYMTITDIPQFNTVNLKMANSMFWSCTSLINVPLLNFSKVESLTTIFWNCIALTNLGGFTGLKIDLNLSDSPLLTVDSVINVINNAADMTSSPKTLTLHQDVFNKLTEEQITTANAKGWNIAAD